MGLLSANITKPKKLRLKLPEPEVRELEAPTLPAPEKPVTKGDLAYTELSKKNPLLDKLVDTFGLVNEETGRPLRKIGNKAIEAPQQPIKNKAASTPKEIKKQPVRGLKQAKTTRNKLEVLANKIMQGENHYSREDLVAALQKETEVSRERAENGIALMIENKIIDNAGGNYFLSGSTPF